MTKEASPDIRRRLFLSENKMIFSGCGYGFRIQ